MFSCSCSPTISITPVPPSIFPSHVVCTKLHSISINFGVSLWVIVVALAGLFIFYLDLNNLLLFTIEPTITYFFYTCLHSSTLSYTSSLRTHLSLPHSSTIQSWSAGVRCKPGFHKKQLLCIAHLAQDGQKDFVLLIDEKSIKKETKWVPKNQTFVGTVDYPYKIATNVLL